MSLAHLTSNPLGSRAAAMSPMPAKYSATPMGGQAVMVDMASSWHGHRYPLGGARRGAIGLLGGSTPGDQPSEAHHGPRTALSPPPVPPEAHLEVDRHFRKEQNPRLTWGFAGGAY